VTEQARKLEDLEWVGGHPALDFVNTVNAWTGNHPGAEYLLTYEDLLRWHRLAGLIGSHGSRSLSMASTPDKATALQDALAFRGALHRIFHSVAAGQSLPQRALDHLNDALRRTVKWRRLLAAGREIRCGWDFTGAPPDAILGPVTWQAAELLEHGELDRIKECPALNGCGWLFLDSSKNRSRTWCSMKTCGNSAKVKRFRARHEHSSTGGKRMPTSRG
jgi:predicted RNA-binding Zn ribbon-like protein